jgi:hypothetical protein
MIADTTPDAADVRLAIYRRMPPAQRCAIAARMSADARAVTLAGIRSRHADYDEEQLRLAEFRLLVGDEVVGSFAITPSRETRCAAGRGSTSSRSRRRGRWTR